MEVIQTLMDLKTMVRTTTEITRQFLGSQVAIILSTLKFLKQVSVVMPSSSLVIMRTLKLNAKSSTSVLTTRRTIFFAPMARSSTSNSSFAFGGINSTVTQPPVFIT